MTQNTEQDDAEYEAFRAEFSTRDLVQVDAPDESAWSNSPFTEASRTYFPIVNDPAFSGLIDRAVAERTEEVENEERRAASARTAVELEAVTPPRLSEGVLGAFGVATPGERDAVVARRKADADAAEQSLLDRKALHQRMFEGPRDSALSKAFGALNDAMQYVPDPLGYVGSLVAPTFTPLRPNADFSEWEDSVKRRRQSMDAAIADPNREVTRDGLSGWSRNVIDSTANALHIL